VNKIELDDATESLAEYVKCLQEEPLIIVHKGVALAAVVPLDNMDYESVELSTNPRFIEILERSRARYRKEGGISSEDMKKQFGEGGKRCN
jgi:hypothetical protein